MPRALKLFLSGTTQTEPLLLLFVPSTGVASELHGKEFRKNHLPESEHKLMAGRGG